MVNLQIYLTHDKVRQLNDYKVKLWEGMSSWQFASANSRQPEDKYPSQSVWKISQVFWKQGFTYSSYSAISLKIYDSTKMQLHNHYMLILVNTRKDLRQILSIVSTVNSVSSASKLGLRSEPGILPINTCFFELGAEHSGQYQITFCYAPSIFLPINTRY